jgi:hypothetical protein
MGGGGLCRRIICRIAERARTPGFAVAACVHGFCELWLSAVSVCKYVFCAVALRLSSWALGV